MVSPYNPNAAHRWPPFTGVCGWCGEAVVWPARYCEDVCRDKAKAERRGDRRRAAHAAQGRKQGKRRMTQTAISTGAAPAGGSR